MATKSSAHIDHVFDVAARPDKSEDSNAIERSWRRSVSLHGVDPASKTAPTLLTAAEVRDLRHPARQLIEVAQGELDHLYAAVRPARYVILLCDKNGIVVDHRGQESEAREFIYWGTWLGGVWAEDAEGTNGIGTCIAEQRAVTVHRSQHFRARHAELSCSGAPIFAPRGDLLGVLDVSSIDPKLSEHAHMLAGGLTIAAARAIEERLFRDDHRKHCIFAILSPRDDSSMLLAVDRDGRIVGWDRFCKKALPHWIDQIETGTVGLSTIFEYDHRVHSGNAREDAWLSLRPVGAAEEWPAIVTPPIPDSNRLTQPEREEFNLRPRREMLSMDRWKAQVPPTARGGLTPTALRRVHDFIDARLAQNIDLHSLAVEAGLSTYHFARAFRQSEGTTPHSFILERRLAKARELLKTTDLPLVDIAQMAGFADQSHFTRRFRESVGMSPGRFRRTRE